MPPFTYNKARKDYDSLRACITSCVSYRPSLNVRLNAIKERGQHTWVTYVPSLTLTLLRFIFFRRYKRYHSFLFSYEFLFARKSPYYYRPLFANANEGGREALYVLLLFYTIAILRIAIFTVCTGHTMDSMRRTYHRWYAQDILRLFLGSPPLSVNGMIWLDLRAVFIHDITVVCDPRTKRREVPAKSFRTFPAVSNTNDPVCFKDIRE